MGKTTFLYQFTDGIFNPRFTSTVGVDFRQKRIIREVPINEPANNVGEINGIHCRENIATVKQKLHLQLWDTAGQERYYLIEF